ncbi:MAG: HIT family protein [Bacillota bacterium]
MSDCIFCKMVNKEIPSGTLFEDDDFLVILDKFPATKGHVLVIPKVHAATIFDLSKEQSEKIFPLVTKIANQLKKNLPLEGLNLLQNNGEIAGQSVPHFHIHLIPRYKDDGVVISSKTDELPNDAMEALVASLKIN